MKRLLSAVWRDSPTCVPETTLTIALLDVSVGLDFKGRAQALQDWGFKCKCPLCSGHGDQIKVSDMRRELLRDGFTALQKGGLKEEDIGERRREAIFLIDNESLGPVKCQLHQFISQAYIDVGNLKSARRYLKQADKTCDRFGGTDHGSLGSIQSIRESIEKAVSSAAKTSTAA
jgi:hypothetical protein